MLDIQLSWSANFKLRDQGYDRDRTLIIKGHKPPSVHLNNFDTFRCYFLLLTLAIIPVSALLYSHNFYLPFSAPGPLYFLEVWPQASPHDIFLFQVSPWSQPSPSLGYCSFFVFKILPFTVTPPFSFLILSFVHHIFLLFQFSWYTEGQYIVGGRLVNYVWVVMKQGKEDQGNMRKRRNTKEHNGKTNSSTPVGPYGAVCGGYTIS